MIIRALVIHSVTVLSIIEKQLTSECVLLRFHILIFNLLDLLTRVPSRIHLPKSN